MEHIKSMLYDMNDSEEGGKKQEKKILNKKAAEDWKSIKG